MKRIGPIKLTAIIMAGGKGSRLGGKFGEKPLVKIGGIEMLRRVDTALKGSRYISRILVACSPYTPRTLNEAKRWGMRVVVAPGKGYVEDMKYVMRRLRLQHAALVVNSDLPLLTSELVDRAVESFLRAKKPALEVVVLSQTMRELGFEPSYPSPSGLSPAGLNILDAKTTKAGDEILEQEILIIKEVSELININTPKDIQKAERLLANRLTCSTGEDA
jgi:adenosylcobinamide-phosphate guanylyltransferase